jgi:hypothetical protein
MPINTFPDVPARLNAGDTIRWEAALPDYPASSWTLAYYFDGPAKFTVEAVAAGDSHLVTIPAAASSGYAAGQYRWTARASNGAGETVTVCTGAARIAPDPAVTTASAAQLAYEAALAAYRALATKKVTTASANGKSFTIQTLGELRKAVDQLREDWSREQTAARMAAGLGNGARVLTRFR